MNNSITNSIIGIVLTVFSQISFAQAIKMPEIEGKTKYIGPYMVQWNYGSASTPESRFRVGGYDFEVTLKIIYKTETSFEDNLFGIVCVMQDGSSLKLLIDPNNVSSFSSREYEYKFPIRMKNEGWVQIFLTKRSDFLLDDDPRVYKNTRNRLSLYLTPQ